MTNDRVRCPNCNKVLAEGLVGLLRILCRFCDCVVEVRGNLTPSVKV
jgi:phage FluMu protein Com